MLPSRPDVNKALLDEGHRQGQGGFFNQWTIQCLQEGDVIVVDMFDKTQWGTYVGGIWPFIQLGISNLGTLIAKGGAIGCFFFEFIKRLLIPFGLHHLLLVTFWQTPLGGVMDVAGKTYIGAQNIVFAQLADPYT